MISTRQFLALVLVASTLIGCRVPGYSVPKEGVPTTDPSGAFELNARKLKATKKGFTIHFELANKSDQGLLIPLNVFEASWGDQLGDITLDPGVVRKSFTVVTLRRPGVNADDLFAGSEWVTGRGGEPALGEAIYLKPNSRSDEMLVVGCKTPAQPGGSIAVRVRKVLSGDSTGAMGGMRAENVVWMFRPTVED